MRPAGRSRTMAAAVAVVVLLAQLGSLAHGALSMHARCEHGELVEADEADFVLALTQALRTPGPASVTASTTAGGWDGDHLHCLAQLHARAALVLRRLSLEIAAPPGAPARGPASCTFTAQRDRYRLVPKQSPPA